MAQKEFIISNEIEAENALILIMQRQDYLRGVRNTAAVNAANAERECQYQTYFCQVLTADNKLVQTYHATNLIAEFLPMPANFPW